MRKGIKHRNLATSVKNVQRNNVSPIDHLSSQVNTPKREIWAVVEHIELILKNPIRICYV